jgi:hypothetical protein
LTALKSKLPAISKITVLMVVLRMETWAQRLAAWSQQSLAAGQPGIEEDLAFHRAIAQASNNRFLAMTLAAIAEQSRFGIRLVRDLSARPAAHRRTEVCREHAAIEAAMQARGWRSCNMATRRTSTAPSTSARRRCMRRCASRRTSSCWCSPSPQSGVKLSPGQRGRPARWLLAWHWARPIVCRPLLRNLENSAVRAVLFPHGGPS